MLADTLQEPSLQVDIQEQDGQEGIGVNLFVVNTVGLLFSDLLLGCRSLMMTTLHTPEILVVVVVVGI